MRILSARFRFLWFVMVCLGVSGLNPALAGQEDSSTRQSSPAVAVNPRADWAGDLAPIPRSAWRLSDLRHLLERAGFGATDADVQRLGSLSPKAAVRHFTRARLREGADQAFVHSGVFDEGLDPFPPSRPATTRLAKEQGEALGVKVKPGGNRPLQPVVNTFFYWLRASRLETDRVAYWWANRMLTSDTPLIDKTALFWHGHFATNEDKVRDYRKMLGQLELFRRAGLGDFEALLLGVAKDPAMLSFLDAGVNVKQSPNENFAREIMELFTMGVGNYSERDVREAARAFTGWNFDGLAYQFVAADHDSGDKTFLGNTRPFTGEEIISEITAQEVTARYLAVKLYQYFVRDDVSDEFAQQLGRTFRAADLHVGRFLEVLLLSRDFYAPQTVGGRIKPPVELVVSTYRKLGLTEVPGVPDFNVLTGALGQRLLHPPTVAGWSQGRSWITPSLLFERGNFVLDLLFPDISFVPPDRYPSYGANIVAVQKRLRAGESISRATRPPGMAEGAEMAASNALADADEAFNTRYGSYRGWQMAIERVLPIPRNTARVSLSDWVQSHGLASASEVVDYWVERFFVTEPPVEDRQRIAMYLSSQLGTDDMSEVGTFAEEALRSALHLLLSLPEYQLD